MLKRHGSVNSDTTPIERKDEEEEYNLQPDNQSKVQKEEYLIKNVCYSVIKYYPLQTELQAFFVRQKTAKPSSSLVSKSLPV